MKKKILFNRILLFIIIILLFLGLFVCKTNPGLYTLLNEKNTQVSTPLPSKTLDKEPGISSIRIPTSIPNPLVALTRVPTDTVEWVPVPTLSKEKAREKIIELFNNNGNCNLPCWFGINPGVTSWPDARRFFEPFSTVGNDQDAEMMINGKLHHLASHLVTFEIPDEEREWGALLVDQDGKVVFIAVDAIIAKKGGFVLSKLLSDYGKPDQIYIRTTMNVPGSELPFRLVLYYRELNIMIDYQLVGRKIGESICVDPKYEGPVIYLWSTDSRYEVAGEGFPEWALFSSEKEPLQIEQVTDFNVESFYQTFKDPKSSDRLCSLINKWP